MRSGILVERTLDIIGTVAETQAAVLISGECGTGKEVVARAIHAASPRARTPFIAIHCGAITEALLEIELLGHARGATLFLDEIGDLPLAIQVKLLRVLKERQLEVLGESVSRAVDVRVIAATHRDLRPLVSARTFREDLYYLLDRVELRLPALRERPADIPLLVQHFVALSSARHQCEVTGAIPEVLIALADYAWPGNVRELGNVVERMVSLRKRGLLEMADLPAQLTSKAPIGAPGRASPSPIEGLNPRAAVDGLEDSLIAQALQRTGGNRLAVAQLLGLNRTRL